MLVFSLYGRYKKSCPTSSKRTNRVRTSITSGVSKKRKIPQWKADPRQISDKGRTDNAIAEKLGIGSRDTYRKEKYIYENQSSLPPEDFADWDEGRLSTNKAYQQIKARLQQQEEQLKTKQEGIRDCVPPVQNAQTE